MSLQFLFAQWTLCDNPDSSVGAAGGPVRRTSFLPDDMNFIKIPEVVVVWGQRCNTGTLDRQSSLSTKKA
jgi:hypothetical protein